MIVVRVELWPFGLSKDRRVIADATIQNRGSRDAGSTYDYRAEVNGAGDVALAIVGSRAAVDIVGHDRRQSVWKLLYRVLSKTCNDDDPASNSDTLVDRYSERKALALFLDVLPAAWALTEAQFERLLEVSPGWHRAWRNHEIAIDDAVASRIWDLGALQDRIGLLHTPESYAEFWHHRWAAESPIGNRSPWEAFEDEGAAGLAKVKALLDSGYQ